MNFHLAEGGVPVNSKSNEGAKLLRIVGAIAAKDIVDAIKNKTILMVVLGLVFLILSTQVMPFLLKLNVTPKAALLDPGKSTIMESLRSEEGFSLRPARSIEEMERMVSESGETILGLVIPLEFDGKVQAGETVVLEGYVASWAKEPELVELVALFEEAISEATGQTVSIRTEGNNVFPRPDAGGRPLMNSIGFLIAIIMVGSFIVPHLMVEEKEMHTMDSLLVSPASYTAVVLGKAVAGMFFCLVAAGVVFVFSGSMIHLWGVAILAAICGALLTVSIGLFMGILFENAVSMSLWLGLLMLILVAPVFASEFGSITLPDAASSMLTWFPSVGLARAFRTAFAEQPPLETVPNLAVSVAVAVFFLVGVVWRVRQLDR